VNGPRLTIAAQVVDRLRAAGQTTAVAESLTGGLVCADLVDVPGASAVLRGGVVAYATDLKHSVLGVDAELLASHGAVDPRVAGQMAVGIRSLMASTWGLATTGVAGPDPQDGQAPGTVHLAIAGPDGVRVRSLALGGDRPTIRRASVDAVLRLLLDRVADHDGDGSDRDTATGSSDRPIVGLGS
jgi:nicotinamide-nucleotide amidase